jgi:xanthine dehydrogenase YagR molybdenum-binding subunit
MHDSPLAGARLRDVTFVDGQIRLTRDPSRTVSLTAAMRQENVAAVEAKTTAIPNLVRQWRYSRHAHSAVFAEVQVDEDLGTVHVMRIVSAVAAGRILNPKTARSQILGGVVWGIGMALEEESVLDHVFGRFMNHNLAEYHVPVNADVPDIDVIFVEEADAVVNPLGAKGRNRHRRRRGGHRQRGFPRNGHACPRLAHHARQAAVRTPSRKDINPFIRAD